MVIVSAIAGILLFIGGSAGVILTWINYQVASLNWIEGLLTYGLFLILGLAIITIVVATPREN